MQSASQGSAKEEDSQHVLRRVHSLMQGMSDLKKRVCVRSLCFASDAFALFFGTFKLLNANLSVNA